MTAIDVIAETQVIEDNPFNTLKEWEANKGQGSLTFYLENNGEIVSFKPNVCTYYYEQQQLYLSLLQPTPETPPAAQPTKAPEETKPQPQPAAPEVPKDICGYLLRKKAMNFEKNWVVFEQNATTNEQVRLTVYIFVVLTSHVQSLAFYPDEDSHESESVITITNATYELKTTDPTQPLLLISLPTGTVGSWSVLLTCVR